MLIRNPPFVKRIMCFRRHCPKPRFLWYKPSKRQEMFWRSVVEDCLLVPHNSSTEEKETKMKEEVLGVESQGKSNRLMVKVREIDRRWTEVKECERVGCVFEGERRKSKEKRKMKIQVAKSYYKYYIKYRSII